MVGEPVRDGGGLDPEVPEGPEGNDQQRTSHLRSREEYSRELEAAMDRWLPQWPVPAYARTPEPTFDPVSNNPGSRSVTSGPRSVPGSGWAEVERPQEGVQPRRAERRAPHSFRSVPGAAHAARSGTSDRGRLPAADPAEIAGLSQRRLAKAAGTSQGAIARSESGNHTPSCRRCSGSRTPSGIASCSASPHPRSASSTLRPCGSMTLRSWASCSEIRSTGCRATA
jgi:hypothetical protein